MRKNLFSLSDHVIVITGATGLLGRHHADAIAFAKGIPILIDLDQKNVEKMAEKLKQKYKVDATGYAVDITKEKEVEANTHKLLKRYGKIDALVNNAANNPKVENQKENG